MLLSATLLLILPGSNLLLDTRLKVRSGEILEFLASSVKEVYKIGLYIIMDF